MHLLILALLIPVNTFDPENWIIFRIFYIKKEYILKIQVVLSCAKLRNVLFMIILLFVYEIYEFTLFDICLEAEDFMTKIIIQFDIPIKKRLCTLNKDILIILIPASYYCRNLFLDSETASPSI